TRSPSPGRGPSRSIADRKDASVLPDPVGAWMRTCSPLAIAGQPSSWAGVGVAKARSNHTRVSGANAASGSGRPMGPGYYRAMAQPLWFTDDPAACQLLADDPFALLVGFAIDQQVPVQKAFAGPYVLKERVGTLDPKRLAATDL